MTDKILKLARCPCGEVPERLLIVPIQSAKWAMVCGSCCGDWHVEFCTEYKALDSPECTVLAAQAWNDAPRGKP
jgi:hypothetical protein